MKFRLILCIGVFFSCLLTSNTNYAAEKKFGEYIVHYNAFASDFLSPKIATHYGITRSRNHAVLNITVQQLDQDDNKVPVDAKVEVNASTLYQKSRSIQLRRVEDGDAIYQLAEFEIINQETLNFTITVGDDQTTIGTIKFKQQFFTD